MSKIKFRTDIDLRKTWLVSDTHFGHENIVGFCARPEDHDQLMIAEWRKEVPDDATVIHLGDLCYKGNTYFRHVVAPELTGKNKLLILGNHDRKGIAFYRKCGFYCAWPFALGLTFASSGMILDPRAVREESVSTSPVPWVVTFSHYPWGEPEDAGRIPSHHWRIHGHIHNNGYTRDGFVPFLRNHINLSVEQTHYRPINLGLLLDAVLLGEYPATTEAQLADARARKEAHAGH